MFDSWGSGDVAASLKAEWNAKLLALSDTEQNYDRQRQADQFIFSARQRERFIAYNTRFLILPWVRVPHLASHLLGRMAAVLSGDWRQMYSHPIYFAETFIDPGRFRGTCYRAAIWQLLGLTTGRGKNDQTRSRGQRRQACCGELARRGAGRRIRAAAASSKLSCPLSASDRYTLYPPHPTTMR
jgi:Domain of unknown function (DUF4338)